MTIGRLPDNVINLTLLLIGYPGPVVSAAHAGVGKELPMNQDLDGVLYNSNGQGQIPQTLPLDEVMRLRKNVGKVY